LAVSTKYVVMIAFQKYTRCCYMRRLVLVGLRALRW